MRGVGLEPLVFVSGLSGYSQSSCTTAINKRVIYAAAGASVIHLASSVMTETPSLVDQVNSLVYEGPETGMYSSQMTHRKCNIRFTDFLTPGIPETGRLIHVTAIELGKKFVKAMFHMINVFLRCLIPFTGYFILQRFGQTDISTPFCFYTFNILHATTKVNHMELALYHGYVHMHPVNIEEKYCSE